jgi:hypothetical protein
MTLPKGYTLPPMNVSQIFNGKAELFAVGQKAANEVYTDEDLKSSTAMQMDYILTEVLIAAAESEIDYREFDMGRFADLLSKVATKCGALSNAK